MLVSWGILVAFFFFFPCRFGNISKQFFLGGMFYTWSLTPLKVETDVKQTMEQATCPLGAD